MLASSLREYVAIVEAGSVSEAARRLDVPRATLSRHLGALEEELGVTLIHRETRRLVLTPAGEELYRRARRIVTETDEAELAVRQLDGVPRGLLRLSIPPTMGEPGTELLQRYMDACPEVSVDVLSTSRHVDLVGEKIDVALRGGVVRDPSLMARRVLQADVLVVAAPSLLEAHPVASLEDLAGLPCVKSWLGGWKPRDTYPLRSGGEVEVTGRLRTNEIDIARSYALRGAAAALIPSSFVGHDLDAGRLVAVLPDQLGFDGSVSVVWPQADHLDPKVRAFIDVAVEFFDDWEPARWRAGGSAASTSGSGST